MLIRLHLIISNNLSSATSAWPSSTMPFSMTTIFTLQPTPLTNALVPCYHLALHGKQPVLLHLIPWPSKLQNLITLSTKRNYWPSIIHALWQWHTDLLGNHFIIYTDHHTLENFMTQKDLSRHQCWWSEFMSQFNCEIRYIDGHKNTIADALSHTTFLDKSVHNPPSPQDVIATLITIPPHSKCISEFQSTHLNLTSDPALATEIWAGYQMDPWCIKMAATTKGSVLGSSYYNQKKTMTRSNCHQL